MLYAKQQVFTHLMEELYTKYPSEYLNEALSRLLRHLLIFG